MPVRLPYEALIASGRTDWTAGARIRVYRANGGGAKLWSDVDDAEAALIDDPRDCEVAHYLRVLRETSAARLVRALSPETLAAVIADREQPSLFAPSLHDERPVLTVFTDVAP